jgi:hypothetical protein
MKTHPIASQAPAPLCGKIEAVEMPNKGGIMSNSTLDNGRLAVRIKHP